MTEANRPSAVTYTHVYNLTSLPVRLKCDSDCVINITVECYVMLCYVIFHPLPPPPPLATLTSITRKTVAFSKSFIYQLMHNKVALKEY